MAPNDPMAAIIEAVLDKLPPRRLSSDEGFEDEVLNLLAEEHGIEADEETAPYLDAVARRLEARRTARRTGARSVASGPMVHPGGGEDPPLPPVPYRFVALNDKVVPAAGTIDLDRPLPGGFCGRIEIEWAAETPILIGSKRPLDGPGIDAPLRLGEGADADYVLPGTSVRGMLRAACEIVGYGRLFQVNRHHRYTVRDFEHLLFRGEHRPQWETLRAGWLSRVPDFEAARKQGESGYQITECRKFLVRIRDLPRHWLPGEQTAGEFHKKWLNTDLAKRHELAGQCKDKRPEFSRPFHFTLREDIADSVRPAEDGQIVGHYVFAGKSPTVRDIDPAKLDAEDAIEHETGLQKKREYVFTDGVGARPIPLTPSAFRRFELAHTKPSKNKRVADGSYAFLEPGLRNGGRSPVFFIGELDQQEDWTFSIGLTRLFKRSHMYSVQEVLERESAHRPVSFREFKPDLVEHLFGYVYEPDELGKDGSGAVSPAAIARKGRVAFGFARAAAAECRETATLETVMMAPRGSFAPFYLAGADKDWSNADARLAGRKRYMPRFAGAADAAGRDAIYRGLKNLKDPPQKPDLISHLRFLEPRDGHEIRFGGEIRLHNVSAEEIGLLLWALSHGGDPTKPYRHMIGRAKAAGAGQLRVRGLRLRLVGNDEAAEQRLVAPEDWELAGERQEGWNQGTQGMASFLRAFETSMRHEVPDWPRTAPVLEWLGACRPNGRDPAEERLYPELDQFRRIRKTRYRKDRLLPADRLKPTDVLLPYRRRG